MLRSCVPRTRVHEVKATVVLHKAKTSGVSMSMYHMTRYHEMTTELHADLFSRHAINISSPLEVGVLMAVDESNERGEDVMSDEICVHRKNVNCKWVSTWCNLMRIIPPLVRLQQLPSHWQPHKQTGFKDIDFFTYEYTPEYILWVESRPGIDTRYKTSRPVGATKVWRKSGEASHVRYMYSIKDLSYD